MLPYLNIIEVTKRVTPDRQIEVTQITMNGLSAFEAPKLDTESLVNDDHDFHGVINTEDIVYGYCT
ncbi:hypothetical protein, partial [Staphylococcus capitis]|uniref:hypothetical protein n=1 Tax=Staphylococcus capitis TaxID=29388 RepID=UPI003D069DBD